MVCLAEWSYGQVARWNYIIFPYPVCSPQSRNANQLSYISGIMRTSVSCFLPALRKKPSDSRLATLLTLLKCYYRHVQPGRPKHLCKTLHPPISLNPNLITIMHSNRGKQSPDRSAVSRRSRCVRGLAHRMVLTCSRTSSECLGYVKGHEAHGSFK